MARSTVFLCRALLLAAALAVLPAVAAPQVSVTKTSSPTLILDYREPCADGRPREAIALFRVTNTAGVPLVGLTASLSGFAEGITLADGESATRDIGRLPASSSVALAYLLKYPCTFGASATLMLSVSDETPGSTNLSTTVTTRSASVSNATGGMVQSTLAGAGAVVGQVLAYDVEYSFGNIHADGAVAFGVSGAALFSDCFRLKQTLVTSSTLHAVPVGTMNRLMFTATDGQGGSGLVNMRYVFRVLCEGVVGQPQPYAFVAQGSALWYSRANASFSAATLPAASMPFALSRVVTPAAPVPGGRATHALTVTNTGAFFASIDDLVEVLPPGASFTGLAIGAACGTANTFVSASNSGWALPPSGAGGTLTFRSDRFGATYSIPAGGRLTLCFDVDYGAPDRYVHAASGSVGSTSIGSEQSTLVVGTPQTITFAGPSDRVFGDAPFTVDASGGESGQPVVFASDTIDVCSSGGSHGAMITVLSAGTCTLRASQAGSATHLPADDVLRSFAVARAAVALALHAAPDPARVRATVTLTALTNAAASGGIEFLRDGVALADCSARSLVDGVANCTVGPLAAGSHTFGATYAGDVSHLPATPATRVLDVLNADPSLLGPDDVELLEDADGVLLPITLADLETPTTQLELSISSDNPPLIGAALLAGAGAQRTLWLVPAADRNGEARITLTVSDGDGGSANTSFLLTVVPVNDPPTVDLAGHRFHPAGASGPQQVDGFALASPGPEDEAAQTVTFMLERGHDPQAVVDTIMLSDGGNLHYTLSGASGAARFGVRARDDGGLDHGGDDTSAPVEFVIAVGDVSALSLRTRRLHPPQPHLADAIAAGTTLASYAIDLGNDGPAAATVALDVRARGLLAGTWECAAPSGCTSAAGTGAVQTAIDLGHGETATVELIGDIDLARSFVEIAAQATAGTTTLQVRRLDPIKASAIFNGGFE
jgi:hypothetical protein